MDSNANVVFAIAFVMIMVLAALLIWIQSVRRREENERKRSRHTPLLPGNRVPPPNLVKRSTPKVDQIPPYYPSRVAQEAQDRARNRSSRTTDGSPTTRQEGHGVENDIAMMIALNEVTRSPSRDYSLPSSDCSPSRGSDAYSSPDTSSSPSDCSSGGSE